MPTADQFAAEPESYQGGTEEAMTDYAALADELEHDAGVARRQGESFITISLHWATTLVAALRAAEAMQRDAERLFVAAEDYRYQQANSLPENGTASRLLQILAEMSGRRFLQKCPERKLRP